VGGVVVKRNDPFFYNSRTRQWSFFGTPEEELTGLQVAYILSMDDKDIAEHVKDDVLVLSGCPFMNIDDNQFYKKLFVLGGYHFFVNIANGAVCRVCKKDVEKFVYTD
jgi:hypothetical protein